MNLDIVLLPPKRVSEQIGRFVRKLGKVHKLKMAVDNKKLLPHVSLLHIKTSKDRIPALLKTVRSISQKNQKPTLQFTKPNSWRDYFMFDLNKPKELVKLHHKVVFKTHKFRTGFCGVGNLKGDRRERQYIKQYGAGNILENFQPHITLGLAENPESLDHVLSALAKKESSRFKVDRLAVTQVNRHHQVFKIIRELRLR